MPNESLHVFEIKISELQKELESKDKRMVRLKEVLNARVQEFREAICCILGYKVDLQPHGTIKFTSIYASQRSFEFDAQGRLMMTTGDHADLQEGIETYLDRSHVPAFMSWLTLYLFQHPS